MRSSRASTVERSSTEKSAHERTSLAPSSLVQPRSPSAVPVPFALAAGGQATIDTLLKTLADDVQEPQTSAQPAAALSFPEWCDPRWSDVPVALRPATGLLAHRSIRRELNHTDSRPKSALRLLTNSSGICETGCKPVPMSASRNDARVTVSNCSNLG